MIHPPDRTAGTLPRTPEPPLARCGSDRQALSILGPDLTRQMLAQRLFAVRPEIIVEIAKPWLEHDDLNPDLGGSGTQLLCGAMPRGIAVDGNVEALQPFWQQDGSEVT